MDANSYICPHLSNINSYIRTLIRRNRSIRYIDSLFRVGTVRLLRPIPNYHLCPLLLHRCSHFSSSSLRPHFPYRSRSLSFTLRRPLLNFVSPSVVSPSLFEVKS